MEFYFYHNTETCVGCCACQLACKDHNNLASGEFYRRVRQASFPGEEKARFYSASCNHCERPMCVAACPNGAFYKEADGTVRHDDGKCIGCGKCAKNCPAGAISGKIKSPYHINNDVCIKCGSCKDNCNFDAIYVEM